MAELFLYHVAQRMNRPEQNQGDDEPAWHVLNTCPRCEKKLEAYCRVSGFEHYLPLRLEVKVYQRRKVEARKPLFTGYVFARFRFSQRVRIMQSQQVVRVLKVNDQGGLLNELGQIRKALEVEPRLGACLALQRGMPVRIITGPFCGLEGVVSALKGQTRVMLNVSMIGQGVAVEVTPDMLERV